MYVENAQLVPAAVYEKYNFAIDFFSRQNEKAMNYLVDIEFRPWM